MLSTPGSNHDNLLLNIININISSHNECLEVLRREGVRGRININMLFAKKINPESIPLTKSTL